MVNPWVAKSLKLANTTAYLDSLHTVYPSAFNPAREHALMAEVMAAHEAKDGPKLLKLALKLDKFPVEYPYASIFRLFPKLVDTNPTTAGRISDRLLQMGPEELLFNCSIPKKANTQVGPMFSKYTETLGFPVLDADDFLKAKGIAILRGTDAVKKKFANNHLNAGLKKGPDLVAKKGDSFVIGEAKFLTATGGNQDKAYEDIAKLVRETSGDAKRIGVIDGYLWVNKTVPPTSKQKGGKVYSDVRKSDHVFLTALLLKDFLKKDL